MDGALLPRGASARASGPPAPYVSDVTTTRRICICADRAKTSRLAAPKYPDLGSEFAACHWAILRLVFLSYTPVAGSPNASWSIPTSVPASPRPMSRIGSHIVVTTSPAADARLESSAYLAGESGSRWELTSSRGRSGRRPLLGRSYGSPLRGWSAEWIGGDDGQREGPRRRRGATVGPIAIAAGKRGGMKNGLLGSGRGRVGRCCAGDAPIRPSWP